MQSRASPRNHPEKAAQTRGNAGFLVPGGSSPPARVGVGLADAGFLRGRGGPPTNRTPQRLRFSKASISFLPEANLPTL